MSQRRLCRRTECQQDSPHTLLLYQRRKRRRKGGVFLCCCDRQSNDHQSSSDSRTDHSIQTVITVSFPADSSVSHCYIHSSSPLDLPVTATSQTIYTQQLMPVVKSVWMIRIWLLLSHHCHLPVVVRQFEVSVHCVCVQCEFTEN